MAVSGNYILFYLSNKVYRTKNVPCAGTVTRESRNPPDWAQSLAPGGRGSWDTASPMHGLVRRVVERLISPLFFVPRTLLILLVHPAGSYF